MKLSIITILSFGLSLSCFGADDTSMPSTSSNQHAPRLSRHKSIRQGLAVYNQQRIDRSRDFEAAKKLQIATELPSDIKQSLLGVKGREFSTVAAANTLLKSLDSRLEVTRVDALTGGFVSGKIYRVTALDTDNNQTKQYYIKYLRTKPILVSSGRCYGEQFNMEYLSKNEQISEIQDYVHVTLPEMMYQYTLGKKTKVFMLIPAAAGQSFTKIVSENDVEEANQAFAALGTALGQLHTLKRHFTSPTDSDYPRTLHDFINTSVYSHGDMHGDNIFFEKSKNVLSFIDVETMANSFDIMGLPNSPICYDFLYMLLMSPKKFGKFMPKNDWAPFKVFLKAYTDVYPEQEREGIYKYLRYCLGHVEKIKFVDIFKDFKIKKGFSKDTLLGAKNLADYVNNLRLDFAKQVNSDRNYVEEFKQTIEQYHSRLRKAQGMHVNEEEPAQASVPNAATTVLVTPSHDIEIPALPPIEEAYLEKLHIHKGRVSDLCKKFEALSRNN